MATAKSIMHDTVHQKPMRTVSLMTAFHRRSYPIKLVIATVCGFFLGTVTEIFACKTHLYESVMYNKEQRRYELDEFVGDYHEKIKQWQAVDAAAAAATRK